MERKYYLAYGSNLNIEQMTERCPSARLIGTAVLEGWELIFKGSKTGSYLTIEKKNGGSVPVGVWSVTEADERSLDRYEGCPDFYYKKELKLPVRHMRSGATQTHRAFVYIMHEERPLGIPSPYYLSVCVDGYRDFGFELDPLADAYARSKEGIR